MKKSKSPPPKKQPEAKKEKSAPAASSAGFKGDDGTTMYPVSYAKQFIIAQVRNMYIINLVNALIGFHFSLNCIIV